MVDKALQKKTVMELENWQACDGVLESILESFMSQGAKKQWSQLEF